MGRDQEIVCTGTEGSRDQGGTNKPKGSHNCKQARALERACNNSGDA